MTGLGSSCGACKFLRRKCTSECIFAPYFCYDQAASHFAAVHKVFGASNVSKLLLHLPVQNRGDAAITIAYEALARMRDPTYGCVAHIFALQQQVASLQEEIENLESHMASLTGFSTGVSLQDTITAGNGLEFSPQCEHINAQYYQNQQAPTFFHAQDATANHNFSSQISGSALPLSQQQDQYPSCGFETDVLAELLLGVAPDINGCYPWLDSDSQANGYV